MKEYLIAIHIINSVIDGKNLNDAFSKNIISDKLINISKIKDLTSGVIRYYESLVILLDQLVSKKISDKNVFILILIALYEINYTTKPHYSIVNYLVDISYDITKNNKIKNFVNAVLRNYLRARNKLYNKLTNNLEFKYSIAQWWIDKLSNDYPDDYENILESSNYIPKICLRINNAKTSLNEYIKLLESSQISYVLIDNKIVFEESISINKLPFFAQGFVSVQNVSAQKLIDFININENANVLDACCAPGGKMCHILENFQVKMTGLDIDEDRLIKVQQNLDRISLSAKLVIGDASRLDWWDREQFDLVIADVPCSASGTIKKNPDIKIHRQPNDIRNFVNKQQAIVKNLLKVLKVGGKLLYITCSIFPEENEQNILYIQQTCKNIKIIKDLKIIPNKYYDGFYYCLLEKIC